MKKNKKTQLHNIKLFVCGNQGVGKTAIINRLLKKEFTENYTPTYRADMHITKAKLENNRFNIEICDISGNQKDILESKVFFKGSSIALIVYDLSDPTSFENVKDWLQIQTENSPEPNLIISVIGNKCDLVKDRNVAFETLKSLFEENQTLYIETSAKELESVGNSTNIGDLLNLLLSRYCLKNVKDIEIEPESLSEEDETYNESYQENLALFQKQVIAKLSK